MQKLLLHVVLLLSMSFGLAAGPVQAADAAANLFDNDAACLDGPMAQFGHYIGHWKIEDSQLEDDGVTWTAGAGARWDFYCMGNGTAVQDFWMPNDGGMGTNLRTYNKDTESWDIAWTFTGMPGFAHIQAKQDKSGNIVMTYKSPPQNPPRRITFFPPQKDSWNWKMEFSFDDGASWTEVYRIQATRHNYD